MNRPQISGPINHESSCDVMSQIIGHSEKLSFVPEHYGHAYGQFKV